MFSSLLLMTDNNAPPSPGSHLPRPEPRVWVISSGDSPIGISLAKQILENGDFVVAGLAPSYFPRDEHERRLERFKEFLCEVDVNSEDQWKARLRPVFLDVRLVYLLKKRYIFFVCSFYLWAPEKNTVDSNSAE
jgi:hypothetical protein